MKKLYQFDKETGVFLADYPVVRIEDVQIIHVEEEQTIDGEPIIVTIDLPEPRLMDGLTEEKPSAGMTVVPGISPKRINNKWIQDSEALVVWEASKPVDEKATLQTTDDLIELMLKANTLEELHAEIITTRFGAIPR